jgi:protein phosphatase
VTSSADEHDQHPGGPGSYRLRYTAVTDVGRHRKENQDSGYASERLLVVADGVGGAAYGDVASSTAVHLLRRLDTEPTDDMLPALAGVVHRIHDRLAEMVESDAELDGTSTTVTAGLFDGRRLGVAHIGDSRGYLLRDGVLSQLTRDHTFVQGLVDAGLISAQEALTHPLRSVVLGTLHGRDGDAAVVEMSVHEVRPGNRLMICSDGLTVVPPAGLRSVMADAASPSDVVRRALRAALVAGIRDDVTVAVADVAVAGAPPAAPVRVGAAPAAAGAGLVPA